MHLLDCGERSVEGPPVEDLRTDFPDALIAGWRTRQLQHAGASANSEGGESRAVILLFARDKAFVGMLDAASHERHVLGGLIQDSDRLSFQTRDVLAQDNPRTRAGACLLLRSTGFDAMRQRPQRLSGSCSGRRSMNVPLRDLSLDDRLNRPLAPSLEKLRLRLCLLLMAVDGAAIFGSFLLVGAGYRGEFPSEIAFREASIIAPMFVLMAVNNGFYRSDLLFSARRSFFKCVYSFGLSATFFFIVTFYAKSTAEFSRVIFTFGCLLSVVSIMAFRSLVGSMVRRKVGPSLQNTLIIHAGGPAIAMEPAFHVDAREHSLSPDASDPTNLDRLGRYMENMDRVIISCPHDDRNLWAPLLRAAGVRGEFVSDALRKLGAVKIQNEPGFSSVVVSVRPLGAEARMLKRLLDITLSSIALIVLSPLMAITVLLIKLEDGGPVLFRQRRMGQGNRLFWIYKFRSMRVEASDHDGKRSASRDDDRTTKIGRLLRRTSIDELPQLFNVWRGDMSLVGPRPHALGSQAGDRLFWEVDGRYWNRHVLKPGLTGLAQIRGLRGATASEKDLMERLQADLEYISTWSFWLDIKILFLTLRVFVHKNAY